MTGSSRRRLPTALSPAAFVSAVFVLTAGLVGAFVPPSAAVSTPQDRLVSENPVDWTPQVLDGTVQALAQVGSKMIVGGSFTSVAPASEYSTISRPYLFAFDRSTGVIDADFTPQVDGEVDALVAGADGASVYVGGAFHTVNGQAAKGVVKLSIATGSTIGAFDARTNGAVKTLRLAPDNRLLYVGGQFTTIRGVARQRLAGVDATTGNVGQSLNLAVTGTAWGVGTTTVRALDVTPDGSTMVAIGNFAAVNGQPRDQIALVDLGSRSAVDSWQTDRTKTRCTDSFDSSVQGIDIDPTGSYFALVTTGGSRLNSLCDTASRWELGRHGSGQQPTWVDATGGDSQWRVAATGTAVYTGGHQRWENNCTRPYCGGVQGPGAVKRTGIAALDPQNGLPLSWNPTRDRGLGVFAFLANDQGLWVGSDTVDIGGEAHPRLALLPLDGGTVRPPANPGTFPGELYRASDQLYKATTPDGSSFGPDTPVGNADWASHVRGAFMLSGRLYYGYDDNNFYVAPFDGTTLADPTVVDTHGLNTLTGTVDGFPVADVTGMAYANGRLYYTLRGIPRLLYRYFEPDDEVLGAETFSAGSGPVWATVQGLTVVGGTVYYATADNPGLYRVPLVHGIAGDTGTLVDSSRSWRSAALFVLAPADAPTVPFEVPGASSAPLVGDVRTSSVITYLTSPARARVDVPVSDPDGVQKVMVTVEGPRGGVQLQDAALVSGTATKGIWRATLSYAPHTTGPLYVNVEAYDVGHADVHLDHVARFGTTPVVPRTVRGDFNGDGRTDLAVWRPSDGRWYVKGAVSIPYGRRGDVPVAADYTGDRRTDLAVWRPSNGRWYVKGIWPETLGGNGDVPVPGDYNGDGRADPAVWTPSTGAWSFLTGPSATLGVSGDVPVPSDYTGDRKTDLAVWRPSTGEWYVGSAPPVRWGAPGDVPVPGDYNADGRADLAVWRPSTGRWYVRGTPSVAWGASGDIPVPGDFNGDRRSEIAVWRPSNSRWYDSVRWPDGGTASVAWGDWGDIPAGS